jgi:hypothetical protein
VVPRGLDQQPSRVAVTGLGDRALAAVLTAGVLRWYQAQVRADRGTGEPVQSPISVASPNAVRVLIPRRQPSRPTIGANGALAGHLGDRGIQPVATRPGGQHRVESLVENQPHPDPLEPHRPQPCLVRAGPGRVLPQQSLA